MAHRILIFSLAYSPRLISGAEEAIIEITDRIDPRDIEFHLITLRSPKELPRRERVGNVHVYRVGFGGTYLSKILFVPLAALTARTLHASCRFDGMWAMMTYMTLPLMLAKWIGVRVPHAITFQDGDPYEKVFERWFIKPVVPIIDRGIKTAAVIQTISTYLATWPKKRGYAGVVERIYNGANPKDISSDRDVAAISRIHDTYKKKKGDVWLINTARLVYQKGFDDTIHALLKLPDYVKFMIVGGGEDEGRLRELVRTLGLEHRVYFVGHLDRNEVPSYRHAADIFVMPSRSEGLGNAGLSAMASGLPFVGTREGGLAEYVFDDGDNREVGKTAWVVRKDSPDQIAGAVNDILENPENVKEVTERARRMILEKYDWDAIAEDMRTRVFDVMVGSS